MLNRDQILAAEDLKHEDVPVAEWGGDVRIRVMTGAERDSLYQTATTADGKVDNVTYKERLLARCIVGEDGKAIFSDEDVVALKGKSIHVLERLFLVAYRMNLLGEEGVESAAKN